MGEIRPFWSLILKPGEATKVDFPDTCFLTITNVCMPELPSDENDTAPIRLFAKVHNHNCDHCEDGKCTESENTVLLASLIPKTLEQVQLNYVFSPINEVELTVKGSVPVHVTGITEPLFLDEEEEEEEEEKHEEEVPKEKEEAIKIEV